MQFFGERNCRGESSMFLNIYKPERVGVFASQRELVLNGKDKVTRQMKTRKS